MPRTIANLLLGHLLGAAQVGSIKSLPALQIRQVGQQRATSGSGDPAQVLLLAPAHTNDTRLHQVLHAHIVNALLHTRP